MGYEWLALNEAERGVVLALAYGQAEAETFWEASTAELCEGEDEAATVAALKRLARPEIGYVMPMGEVDREWWELLSRGWRWLEETLASSAPERLFLDAEPEERIAWGVLGQIYRFGKHNVLGESFGEMLALYKRDPVR